MQAVQLNLYCDFAFAGLRISWHTIAKMVMDKGGTAIMAYAFLSGLIALGAVVSFGATGTAVAKMYNVISTVFVASLQPTP